MTKDTKRILAMTFISLDYDTDERESMIKTACAPYSSIVTEERSDLIEYVEENKELLSKDVLTGDEEAKLDFFESWVQERALKYQIQKNAIAISILMVLGKYMDSRLQGVLNLYKRKYGSRDIGKTRMKLYALGEQEGGVAWGTYIWAMGNYVRHHHQWSYSHLVKTTILGEERLVWREIELDEIDRNSQTTVETLTNLEYSVSDVVNSTRDLSSEFVEKLKLHDADSNLDKISKWINELKKYAVEEFFGDE